MAAPAAPSPVLRRSKVAATPLFSLLWQPQPSVARVAWRCEAPEQLPEPQPLDLRSPVWQAHGHHPPAHDHDPHAPAVRERRKREPRSGELLPARAVPRRASRTPISSSSLPRTTVPRISTPSPSHSVLSSACMRSTRAPSTSPRSCFSLPSPQGRRRTGETSAALSLSPSSRLPHAHHDPHQHAQRREPQHDQDVQPAHLSPPSQYPQDRTRNGGAPQLSAAEVSCASESP